MKRWLAVAAFVAGLGGAMGCAESKKVLEAPPQTNDAGITNLINRRVSLDQRLCPYDITVVVYNRTARLEGKVAGEPERRQAEKIALDAGALQVDDQLTIDTGIGDAERC